MSIPMQDLAQLASEWVHICSQPGATIGDFKEAYKAAQHLANYLDVLIDEHSDNHKK